MKIGIMGGTFNPIHNGHLLLAETAYEDFDLDKVLIMPVKEPAHRNISSNVSAKDRINMVELAIKDNPHFELSLLEMEREGYTYTVDTVRQLKEEHPEHEYYFIMGADSLYHFESWKEPDEILRYAVILAAGRDHIAESELEAQIEYLLEKYPFGKIFPLLTPSLEISSHNIRKRVRNERSIRYLLPKEVEEYALTHKLYQTTNSK